MSALADTLREIRDYGRPSGADPKASAQADQMVRRGLAVRTGKMPSRNNQLVQVAAYALTQEGEAKVSHDDEAKSPFCFRKIGDA